MDMELAEPTSVKTFLELLAEDIPKLHPLITTTLVAINQEYAFPDTIIQDGDEVALFPPVSGGHVTVWPEYFAITQHALDIDGIVSRITDSQTGATYLFVGTVRGITQHDKGRLSTEHLVYEAYSPMAEQKLRQIAEEIRQRYPKVQGIAIVQRIGKLAIGETTVLVACAAGHRKDGCLEAAQYGIDRLKEIVPVWKKEISPGGEVWVEGHYHPTPSDVRIVKPQPLPTGRQTEETLSFTLKCSTCDRQYPWTSAQVHCSCGSPLEPANTPRFDERLIVRQAASMWRYRSLLMPSGVACVTLGEGWTPLITVEALERVIHLKMESLNPTGSFKARGASMLVSLLKTQRIGRIHDDSSGNAGAALAAYAARAGLSARVYVPDTAAPHKLAQIELYGAQLYRVAGPREAATQAAQQASNNGTSFYASHVYNPSFISAYKSTAYELWEQLDHRAPDIIVMPVGHGTQLLGIAAGFNDLLQAGIIDHLPRLIGVQAQACAPLWYLSKHSTQYGDPPTALPTLADGIHISHPTRGKQVIDAINSSDGEIIAVSEAEIRQGIKALAYMGILVEPTSAVVWPALQQITVQRSRDATIVLIMTGSGLGWRMEGCHPYSDNQRS